MGGEFFIVNYCARNYRNCDNTPYWGWGWEPLILCGFFFKKENWLMGFFL